MGPAVLFDWFPLVAQNDRSMMVRGRNGRFLRDDASASAFNAVPTSLSALAPAPRLASMSAVEVVCDPKSAWQIEVFIGSCRVPGTRNPGVSKVVQ